MKKIVCLTLVLMIMFSFIGCSASKSNNMETDNTDTTDRFIEVYYEKEVAEWYRLIENYLSHYINIKRDSGLIF